MINDIIFGKRRTYKVETDAKERLIAGRRFAMKSNGFLIIYDAWWSKVATLRDVKSIIEIGE